MDKTIKLYKEWRFFIFLLLLMSVFRSAVADWYTVPTGSMKPTILEGDRIFVNKMAYGLRIPFTTIPIAKWSVPARGDVVVFESTAANNRLVKRVIGIPGDTVQLVANQLYVNGRQAEYRTSSLHNRQINWGNGNVLPLILNERLADIQHEVALSHTDSFYGPVTVPENHLFVLGDNRDLSADSRFIGFVPMNEVLGKAKGVIVSLDPDSYYLPRKARFFKAFDSDI